MVKVTDNIIWLSGELTSQTIPELSKLLTKLPVEQDADPAKPINTIDISAVTRLDSAGVAFLESLQDKIRLYSKVVFLQGTPQHLKPILKTLSSAQFLPETKQEIPGFFEQLGDGLIQSGQGFYEFLIISADVFYWSIAGLWSRNGQRKGSFTQQGIILGVQALPVVGLLSLIIGFILSLQSAAQLRNFGANVFIADLLAVSLVREMGPMMTAIIIAGRSGSAIASEIASMQVSEEIDALRMMAINPIRYVVVPKFHAITLVMPILVAFAILIGEIGGLAIAVGYLDLSVDTFVTRTIDILSIKDIIVSLSKSTFFAWLIVIIGSYFGFSVKGGAEGVGKATTSSVVASIFAVILFDALFSLLYL
jgi:phospholipid/cholesterol/gamma-HCH transport system permease protein